MLHTEDFSIRHYVGFFANQVFANRVTYVAKYFQWVGLVVHAYSYKGFILLWQLHC